LSIESGAATRPTVSAIVVCYNEEDNIGPCLESLVWCDEIVVVDSFSTDRTVEICRQYTELVILRAWAGYVPYGISKAGVVMLTRGLAAALAPRIQVNAVAPGVVLLPEGFPRESGRRLAARIPMGRHGRPADVAQAVRFFATCSDYVTGQVLFVDGGMSVI
jgi:NAD(P)-dependent dehydrogenase (short-subunit alcohol dehydrogenase family)